MPHDLETLRTWIRICLWVASVCTTLVPFVYAFSPWFRSRLGQLFMLQAIAFAFAMDLTLVFQYWFPRGNIAAIFWVNAVMLTFIAGSTLALAILIFMMNYTKGRSRYDRRESDPE